VSFTKIFLLVADIGLPVPTHHERKNDYQPLGWLIMSMVGVEL